MAIRRLRSMSFNVSARVSYQRRDRLNGITCFTEYSKSGSQTVEMAQLRLDIVPCVKGRTRRPSALRDLLLRHCNSPSEHLCFFAEEVEWNVHGVVASKTGIAIPITERLLRGRQPPVRFRRKWAISRRLVANLL